MMVEPSVDPETQRIQPNAPPARVMSTPCCQLNPYSRQMQQSETERRRQYPGRRAPGAYEQRLHESAKRELFAQWTERHAKIAIAMKEARSLSNSFIGSGASGAFNTAPRIAIANAAALPDARIASTG